MTDPFQALHAPAVPIDPDPAFATRLRVRLQVALEPRGAELPTTTARPQITRNPASGPGIVPSLAVADAPRALAWYVEALGARRRGEPIVMPDGRIGHAELELAGHVLMLSEQHPEIGVVAPEPGQGASVTLHLTVDDVDEAAARAVEAGAELERRPADHPYGRNAVLRDPFGHRWLIASAGAPVRAWAAGRPAGVVYASLWVPDLERAVVFFGAVLGWTYAPGGSPQGRQVEGVTPRQGLWGGHERGTLFLCFAVDDVGATVARVRAVGGRAEAPREEPYGTVADCVDDQGVPFAVVQSPTDTGHLSGSPAAGRPGDLDYITLEMVDSARARAFYSSVLGWRFSPGRRPDAWGVEDVVPMVGMIGGQDRATIIPMYRVGDITAAVERVRAAGGVATEPERQPYGVTSSCTDDQSTRFYLGQL